MTVVTVIEENDPTIVTTPDTSAAAWTAFVPTFRWSVPGGTLATFVVNSARWTQIGKTVRFMCSVTMSNVGIGNSGTLIFTLPVTAISIFVGSGHEVGLGGKMLCVTNLSTAEAYIVNYDGSTVVTTGNGAIFYFGGTYEAA